MIRIQETNKLTQQQTEQIRKLEKQCNLLDGTSGDLWLGNEFNLHENMPCFFLLYEKQTLQGVLTIFAPAAAPPEVSALVLPDCRRKGYFRAMLCKAKKRLEEFALQDILFVHETKSKSGKRMVDAWNIAPHHSEYLLVYDKKFETSTGKKLDVQLVKAQEKDFEEMLILNAAIFGGSENDFTDMLQKSMNNEQILCFKAISDGEIIGVCNVNRTSQGLYIFGFGISPAYQRKGYGRAMLIELTRHLIDTCCDDILLEVDSSNQSAYLLYTTSGFSVKTQYDYYMRKASDIPCVQRKGDPAL